MFAQRETFIERTQHPDAIQVGECRNAPRHQASRDHEFVVAERRSVVESHRLRRGVQAGDRRSEPQRDVLLVVELTRFERHVVDFAAQHFLGQRGAIVWQVDLVADDGQRAAVARLAQLLGGPGRREPSADDQYSVAVRASGHWEFIHDCGGGWPLTPRPATGRSDWSARRYFRCVRCRRLSGSAPKRLPDAACRAPAHAGWRRRSRSPLRR